MKKFTFSILLLAASYFSLAQVEQNSYTFDSSVESFIGEGGNVAASPTGFLTFTPNTLFARIKQDINFVDGTSNKHLHLRVSNQSSSNDLIVVSLSGGATVGSIAITTNDGANFKDYHVELSDDWTGDVYDFKLFPRNSGTGQNATGNMIFDHIIFSNSATLAVEDIESYKSKLYPNPVKDQLYIKTAVGNVTKLELYNLLGTKVASNLKFQ